MHLALTTISLCLAVTAAAQNLPEMRMSPTEAASSSLGDAGVGSSGLATVHTKVICGDPSKVGFYSILLFVPAFTTIQAHSHRDDRMATVVSGTWHFGYGDRFDGKTLKRLPQGSVYSEPGGKHHFARTGKGPVILHISGHGPTDTHYFDHTNDPTVTRDTKPSSSGRD